MKRLNRYLAVAVGAIAIFALGALLASPALAADDGGLVTGSDNTLQNLFAIVAIAAPISIGLVQLLKLQGLPTKYAPVMSLLSGLVVAGLLVFADVAVLTAGQTVLTGVLTGLVAAGTYSGVKAIATN